MIFQSDPYSVLIVSASDRFTTALRGLLPGTDFWPVTAVRSVSEAGRARLGSEYDLVIINSPLPDDAGLELACGICSGSDSAVLLLVPNAVSEEVHDKVLRSGVITLGKPASTQMVQQSLRVLCAVRERLKTARRDRATVEETIADIRLVNRAKWALIENEGMTEPQAHRYLTKQAMEQRLTLRAMAESIIRKYSQK